MKQATSRQRLLVFLVLPAVAFVRRVMAHLAMSLVIRSLRP